MAGADVVGGLVALMLAGGCAAKVEPVVVRPEDDVTRDWPRERGPYVELRFNDGVPLRWPLAATPEDRLWLGGSTNCLTTRDGRFGCWGGGEDTEERVARAVDRTVPVRAWVRCLGASMHFDHDPRCTLVAAPAEPGVQVRWLSADGADRHVLLANGEVRRWGYHPLRPAVRDGVELAGRCARLRDGTMVCWDGHSGALVATGLRGVVDIDHDWISGEVCAVLRSGRVLCGDAGREFRAVEGVDDAVAVHLDSMGCARLADGGVACWDSRAEGTTARRISGAEGLVEVQVVYDQGCGVDAQDDVWCWGDNESFGLGDAASSPFVSTPTYVPGVPPVAEVFVGSEQTCARTWARELWCWGGEFADEGADTVRPVRIAADVGLVMHKGSLYAETEPGILHVWANEWTQPVRLPDSAGAIGSGAKWLCALVSGALHCDMRWSNPGGSQFERIAWSGAVVSLTVTGSHGCVALADGRAACWGEKSEAGALGSGATKQVTLSEPAVVPGLPPVDAVAVHGDHSCARTKKNREAWCWGAGTEGQLGGSAGARGVPQRVTGVPPVAQISVGEAHTCVRSEAGEVWCWGRNKRGQLGRGELSRSGAPARVAGLAGVVSLSTYGDTSCAVIADGGVYCWGDNARRMANLGGPLRSEVAIKVAPERIRWHAPR